MKLSQMDLLQTYLDKRGFLVFRHKPMKPSEHDEAYPVEFLCRGKKVYCYLNAIPYDESYSTLVYFVTGHDGSEHGQFKTQADALRKFDELEAAK